MDEPLLPYVMNELDARRGTWRDLAREIEGDNWKSYYSWLEKLANGRIPSPGVQRIQRLADHFRAQERAKTATNTEARAA